MYNVLIPNVGFAANDIRWGKAFGSKYKLIFSTNPMLYNDVDMIVFTGGADVDPELYGEAAHPLTKSDKKRDEIDKLFYNYGVANRIPMVGVCRGGQFLNVMNGGRMIQHVVNHQMPTNNRHSIQIESTGEVFLVSSTHHQMMFPSKEGKLIGFALGASTTYQTPTQKEDEHFKKEFTVSTYVKEPEIVYYKKTRSLCFQYHPEYMDDHARALKYFKEQVNRLIQGEDI